MILYLRARGFGLVDMPMIENADRVLSKLMEFRSNDEVDPIHARTSAARTFVHSLFSYFNVDPSNPSNCTLYTGPLAGGFSCVMDEIYQLQPIVDILPLILPKWKRNPRFDMIIVQKVVAMSNMGLEIQIDQTKTTKLGKRQNIFCLNLVVGQPK